MRILLPPSEAKSSGGRRPAENAGPPGDQDPDWIGAREQLWKPLLELCRASEQGAESSAADSLLLPPSVAAAAIATNRALLRSPRMQAIRRYNGVLYEGLAARDFSIAQQRSARSSLLIFSGLFGVLTSAEKIPDYRVPAKARLPGVRSVAGFWRLRLIELLPPRLDDGLIVDLRSTDYQAMWRPLRASATARQSVTVRILSKKPDGSLGVVSYRSKLLKGRLAAELLERDGSGRNVATIGHVIDAWHSIGGSGVNPPANAGDHLKLIE